MPSSSTRSAFVFSTIFIDPLLLVFNDALPYNHCGVGNRISVGK